MNRRYQEKYLTPEHCSEIGWKKSLPKSVEAGDHDTHEHTASRRPSTLRRAMSGCPVLLQRMKESGPHPWDAVRVKLHWMTGIWL